MRHFVTLPHSRLDSHRYSLSWSFGMDQGSISFDSTYLREMLKIVINLESSNIRPKFTVLCMANLHKSWLQTRQ